MINDSYTLDEDISNNIYIDSVENAEADLHMVVSSNFQIQFTLDDILAQFLSSIARLDNDRILGTLPWTYFNSL